MKDFFKELFVYNHDTNQKLLEYLISRQDAVSERSFKWMNHILNAHRIWNSRVDPGQQKVGVWDMRPWQEHLNMEKENHLFTLQLIDKYDLDYLIQYQTSEGLPFQNTIKDMLFQVINHSTHHRAQISADLRSNGIEPLALDYIFYKRK